MTAVAVYVFILLALVATYVGPVDDDWFRRRALVPETVAVLAIVGLPFLAALTILMRPR